MEVVRLLHAMKADLEAQDCFGATPAFVAAMDGNVDMVRLLHGLGANIETQDTTGTTPVWAAAFNGHAHMVRLLSDLGANVGTPNQYGRTPVHTAAWKGRAEMVRLLHELQVDVEAQDNHGATPVLLAAQEGRSEMVRLLHGLGADVAASDTDGRTPLSAAVYGGHFETAKALLLLGVPVTVEGLKQQGDAVGDARRLRDELAAWVAGQETTNRIFHSTFLVGCTATEQQTTGTQLSKLAGLRGVREEIAAMHGVAVGVELGRIRTIGRTIAAVDWTAHDEAWDGKPTSSDEPVSAHSQHSHS